MKEAARNPTASELKETQKEHLAHRWSFCPITHRPLSKPVVSDYTGELYNKDGVIQYLLPEEASSLDKVEAEKFVQGRIKSLKDVVEVQFEVEHDEKTKDDKRICPVTSKQLGPSVKAVYIVPCGHAFSLEAIREMKGEQCVQCGQNYESRDVIPILPSTEADKALLMTRMDALLTLGLTHSLKKAHGSKKRKANGAAKVETRAAASAVESKQKTEQGASSNSDIAKPAEPHTQASTTKSSDGIKNAATANLTAKVLEEEEARKKRRKQTGENDNLKSLFTSSQDRRKQRDGDFMTRGFSIAANARHQ